MYENLIIESDSVYELDEMCVKKQKEKKDAEKIKTVKEAEIEISDAYFQ